MSGAMSSSEEIEYYKEIQRKLNEITGISYIKLAKSAFRENKNEIGFRFLEQEKSILTKIPQYTEMRKWDKAMELALETFDSNIIYTVIDKVMTNEDLDTFKATIVRYDRAQ